MKLTPVNARTLKRFPATVNVTFSDGRKVDIKDPSLPAWLGYAKNQGVDTAEPHGPGQIEFWDNGIFIQISMGLPKPRN